MTFSEGVFISSQSLQLNIYLMLGICLFFDLDGLYWIIEDLAPSPMYRSMFTITILLLARALILLPGFLETMRALYFAGFGYLFMVVCIKETVEVLTKQVNNSEKFLSYYRQFLVISNILSEGVTNIVFYATNVAYLLFILVFWVIVRGYTELGLVLYLLYCSLAIFIIFAICMVLPVVSVAGEQIREIVKTKQTLFVKRFRNRSSLVRRLVEKECMALLPIRYSYGSYYPLGRSFSRNLLSNAVENLLSVILIYDFHGRIYKNREV